MQVYIHPRLQGEISASGAKKTLSHSCLVFASQLYLKHAAARKSDPSFPLHSTISRKIYTTRYYAPMVALLKKLRVIEVNGRYKVGQSSKRFRLKSPYCSGVVSSTLHCPKIERRFDRLMTRSSFQAMKGAARKHILSAYRRVSFTPAVDEMMASHCFKSDSARNCTEHHLHTIRERRYRFVVCKHSGRIYYPVANLPKKFRDELLLEGDPVVEIDVAASQPTLLATLYDTDCAERRAYLEYVQAPNFYENVAEWLDQGWTRDMAKTEFFHQIAYGSYFCSANYPLLEPFALMFPQLAGKMAAIKHEGNRALPTKMQKLEANITIDGACGECATEKLYVLPVHDALICKKSEADRVAEIFAKHWFAHTRIPARLRIGPAQAPSEENSSAPHIEDTLDGFLDSF